MGEEPVEVTTLTSTAPAAWLGAVAEICVGERTENAVAKEFPNITAETLANPVPLMVIVFPPPIPPLLGPTPVTVGPDCRKLNWSLEVIGELPDVATTWMSTMPAACEGETAVIDESEFRCHDAAAIDPNRTAVASPKPLPTMLTEVPA